MFAVTEDDDDDEEDDEAEASCGRVRPPLVRSLLPLRLLFTGGVFVIEVDELDRPDSPLVFTGLAAFADIP